MGLIFTGEQVRTVSGVSLRATDQNGKVVAVKLSDEVLQDFGIDLAKDAAVQKYSNGQIEADGSIDVRTSDCNP